MGVQYSFSPELYKQDPHWMFYDQPDVANYSVFYRIPLGNPSSLQDQINANPGSFGYSEATRKFNLPPSAGLPSLTIFASRSTIDTGIGNTLSQTISSTTNRSIFENDFQRSPTINEDIAAHLDFPLASAGNLQSSFSSGLDFKYFQTINYKEDLFTFVETQYNNGNPILPPNTSTNTTVVPTTRDEVEYLPLSLHYTGSWHDSLGTSTAGLGLSANLWYSSLFATSGTHNVTNNGVVESVPYTTNVHGRTAFADIAGSTLSSGYWVVLTPSYSRTILIDNWTTEIRLDGQWASEPLISPEQFGAGGVNSVRGYPEGDVFGDEGWHFSLEEQTPAHVIGMIANGTPLTAYASIYSDFATVYLIDPQGRAPETRLWGTGIGFNVVAGPHWQAQFLFSFPLYRTADTSPYEPRFNFSITGQF